MASLCLGDDQNVLVRQAFVGETHHENKRTGPKRLWGFLGLDA